MPSLHKPDRGTCPSLSPVELLLLGIPLVKLLGLAHPRLLGLEPVHLLHLFLPLGGMGTDPFDLRDEPVAVLLRPLLNGVAELAVAYRFFHTNSSVSPRRASYEKQCEF